MIKGNCFEPNTFSCIFWTKKSFNNKTDNKCIIVNNILSIKISTTSIIHYARNFNCFNSCFLNKELFTEQTFFLTLSVSYSMELMDTVNAMCNTTQSSSDSNNQLLNNDACYGCFSRVIEQSKVRKKILTPKPQTFHFQYSRTLH